MSFTPLAALAGGALIGLASSAYALSHGRIAGVSGLLAGAISPGTEDRKDRVAFLVGLAVAGLAFFVLRPSAFASSAIAPVWAVVLGGLLVGYGTRLGRGCTSGHGVYGLARFSARSAVATATFMATAALTVFVTRHLLGGFQ